MRPYHNFFIVYIWFDLIIHGQKVKTRIYWLPFYNLRYITQQCYYLTARGEFLILKSATDIRGFKLSSLKTCVMKNKTSPISNGRRNVTAYKVNKNFPIFETYEA